MHGPPLPLVPFLLSMAFLGEIHPAGPNSFDPWALFERWGIAAVLGVIAWILWKRDRERDKEAAKVQTALEAERLDVQKQLLQAHKDNAQNMQALIVSNMTAQNATASALHELAEKVHVIPCRANQPPQS